MEKGFLPGVLNFDSKVHANLPDISPEYADSLQRLVYLQSDGVTLFYGCELDLSQDRRVWMSPAEVDDGNAHTYFQILYVNTTPEEVFTEKNVPVSVLEIDEASFKLADIRHPGYQQLQKLFNGGKKQILIRHCHSGMAYYPRPISPHQNKNIVHEHLEKLVSVLKVDEPELKIGLSKPSEREDLTVVAAPVELVHARKYSFGNGEVHSYGVNLENDPWKYYEIFSPHKLEDVSKDDLLLRIDSGCDIGQVYDDQGCDCREQLHTSLTEIQELGSGVVIHIPAQDGRGYGAATKMETEGLKRGIKVATNQDEVVAMDTIAAGEKLLGKNFDIRTYDGVGRLLGILGVGSVILQTDNKLKAQGLEAAGIKVKRKPTNTKGSNGSSPHVHAKHRYKEIYFGKED